MIKIKNIIILLFLFTLLCNMVYAGQTTSTFALGVKQDLKVDWTFGVDYIDRIAPGGYYTTHSLYIDTNKNTISDIPTLKYVYYSDYQWYNPIFPNNYKKDNTPVLIDYCFAMADNPDYNSNYEPINDDDRNIDLIFDVRRDWNKYKVYYDAGSPEYHCWEGGWTVYCWIYLDEDYIANSNVQDYYEWDINNMPNVDDVVDLSITENCNGDEAYCLIKSHYSYYIDTDNSYFDEAGDTECIDHIYEIYDVYLLNITQDILGSLGGEVNIENGTLDNEQSNADDMEGNKGIGETGGEGETGGYQYLKVQGYLLEKEILSQHLNYLGTVINIMKLIYSLILLVFYLIEFLILTYLVSNIVPGMFNKLMDIIKKGGKFR